MTRKWIGKPSPKSRQMKGAGWLGDIDRCFVDDAHEFAVMTRKVETKFGTFDHVAIRHKDEREVTWKEKQQIKDEIFGAERVAIEVFPAESELIDSAMMYHLWVLPEGTTLPDGIQIKD